MTTDLTGETFGKWLVLGKSQVKGGYYICQCQGCGLVKDVSASTLRRGKSRGCINCMERPKQPERSKVYLDNAKQKVGQTINGWKVTGIAGVKNHAVYCTAICPLCHKESTVRLTVLGSITKYANCSRDLGSKSAAITESAYADGSSLPSVRSRVNGKTNANSTTGANGVSRMSNGRYRAYISFRRECKILNAYDTWVFAYRHNYQ